jgi:hypothetical protein
MKNKTRAAGCWVALALVACGGAFTGADDGGTPPGLDGSLDAGPPDAHGKDAAGPRDAKSRDAPGRETSGDEDGGPSDGGRPPSDGGKLDASLCAKTCPSGFDCLAGLCVDRAAQHYGTATATDNWSYGSFTSFGSSPFVPYKATWTTNGIVFTSQTKNVLTSSVFHSITSASYEGMDIPAGTLGLYPGTTTNLDSVVRWTAPEAGSYAISATFTGLGTMPPTTVGVSVNIGVVIEIGMSLDGAMPSISYANPTQSMAAGDTIDFYVNFITLSEDEQGGTGLAARITAN